MDKSYEIKRYVAGLRKAQFVDDAILLRFYASRTKRQQQVIELESDALNHRLIAYSLGIATTSVSEHLSNVYGQLELLDALNGAPAHQGLVINLFAKFFERHPEMRNVFPRLLEE